MLIRLTLGLLMGFMATVGVARADITVLAAASLKGGLDEAAAAWLATTGEQVRLSFAGSSALARQIIQGAPADVFISASPDWMNVVEAEGLLMPDTRRDLFGNQIVLIAHGVVPPVELNQSTDLAGMLGEDRLAMALVDAVPAGIYGKEALLWLGLWPSVADKVAQTDNVRAALALVAWNETPIGVVYATDAMAEDDVSVIATFPSESHSPIVYPAAQISGAREGGAAFLEFLASDTGGAFFRSRGFTVRK